MFIAIGIAWVLLVALLLMAFIRDILPGKREVSAAGVSRRTDSVVTTQQSPVGKKVGPLPVSGPCRQCRRHVNTTTVATPAWYDADQVGWSCAQCQAALCGECCTAKLQELKGKYQASGAALKKAIDNDPMALYFLENSPHIVPSARTDRHLRWLERNRRRSM